VTALDGRPKVATGATGAEADLQKIQLKDALSLMLVFAND
jgi:hypothetical protein